PTEAAPPPEAPPPTEAPPPAEAPPPTEAPPIEGPVITIPGLPPIPVFPQPAP
ncbi:type IV pili twitching motility protein PilT, partial [Mycobacterium pyrenivorans]|nr:type IV pili twitching motility protein PilT [Mycolicibacterium pyrenivorans]